MLTGLSSVQAYGQNGDHGGYHGQQPGQNYGENENRGGYQGQQGDYGGGQFGPGQQGGGRQGNYAQNGYVRHNDRRQGGRIQRNDWNRGQVVDYRRYHLSAPRRGYEWRRVDGNYVLAAVATGLIATVIAASNQPYQGTEEQALRRLSLRGRFFLARRRL